MKKLSVAIVGAGPAGLAAALYLHRAGHAVRIFEQFSEPQPVGSGLMLQPTGMAVLRDLELNERIQGLGSRIDRLEGKDSRSGRTVLEVAYRNRGHGLGVHRTALFYVLFDAVSLAGIALETSADITGVSQSSPQASLLMGDATKSEKFDLIVDASGAKSKIRNPEQAGATRRPLPYGAFWTTLDWCGDGFDKHALQQRYEKASVMIGVLPIGQQIEGGKQKAAFFWSLKPDDAPKVMAEGVDVWKSHVAGYWPETKPYLDQISSLDELVLAQYAHHTLKTPYAGCVAYVGDSAHSTSPQLGQGANMALLDAKALAVSLERNDDLEEALAHYAALRRWHVRLFQFLSLALTPFYQSDGTLIPLARDTLVSTIAKIPPMPGILTSMVAGTLIDPLKPLGLKI